MPCNHSYFIVICDSRQTIAAAVGQNAITTSVAFETLLHIIPLDRLENRLFMSGAAEFWSQQMRLESNWAASSRNM